MMQSTSVGLGFNPLSPRGSERASGDLLGRRVSLGVDGRFEHVDRSILPREWAEQGTVANTPSDCKPPPSKGYPGSGPAASSSARCPVTLPGEGLGCPHPGRAVRAGQHRTWGPSYVFRFLFEGPSCASGYYLGLGHLLRRPPRCDMQRT